MYQRIIRLTVIACLLASVVTPTAGASFESLYDDYLQTGTISGCEHSEAELQAALTSVPSDIQAYDPSFPLALNAALDSRARGCDTGPPAQLDPRAAGGTVLATDGSPGPSAAEGIPVAPLPEGSGTSDFPIESLYLAIVLAALLAGVVAMLPRHRGSDGR